jgi:hypothetical protein
LRIVLQVTKSAQQLPVGFCLRENKLPRYFFIKGSLYIYSVTKLSTNNYTEMGNSITPITVVQNMFMRGGSRWSPKGICYQPVDGSDPLSDDHLDHLTKLLDPATTNGLLNLGINCIRVYQVDPSKNHDKVMDLLASNGIYVLVGAVTSDCCITTTSTSVPGPVVARVKAVADTFARYSNVLGFDISNELLDSPSPSQYGLVSVTKQLKQQMHSYMASQGYRAVPIGCCTRDVPSYTFPGTSAYACGTAEERMDFIGYNTYRWIVPNGQQPDAGSLTAYYELYDHFKNFPVPVMLTEIGAACTGGRDWSQIAYIFGQSKVTSGSNSADMSAAISGCFAFRYYERGQGFGLVQPVLSDNPSPVTIGGYGGYAALSAAYKKVTAFTGTPDGVNAVSCSSLSGNPYAGNSAPTGGLPAAVTVKLTNNITTPAAGRTIAFSYAIVANPGATDWIPAVTIKPLGSSQYTFPKGTQAISMAFQADSSWYGGCQLRDAKLLALKNNDTIQGQAMGGDGSSACPVISG